MGIDPCRLLNHSMYYTNAEELVEQIEKVTQTPVFVGTYFFEKEGANITAPENFDGWKLYTEDGNTLQYHMDKGNLMDIYKAKSDGDSFYINPFLLEFFFDDFYMGRWFEIPDFVEYFRIGSPDPKIYENVDGYNPYYLLNRKKMYDLTKNWGTAGMIIFCNDYHQNWLDHFTEDNWTMEDFIKWGKEKLIYVELLNQGDFKFPERGTKEYYDVFIYDDFSDLKEIDGKNKQ